jgi:hypothetical protein
MLEASATMQGRYAVGTKPWGREDATLVPVTSTESTTEPLVGRTAMWEPSRDRATVARVSQTVRSSILPAFLLPRAHSS